MEGRIADQVLHYYDYVFSSTDASSLLVSPILALYIGASGLAFLSDHRYNLMDFVVYEEVQTNASALPALAEER
jgi:hypothetical protein